MADPFARAVGAAFRRHGIAAVLDPDGAARAVTLLPSQQDRTHDGRGYEIVTPGEVYEIQASDLSGFGVGAILEIGIARRTVRHVRVDDPRRLKAVLDTVPG